MRFLPLVVAVTLGCGGKGRDVAQPAAIAPAYTATRWLPSKPRYVIAAKTVRDAQRSFADVLAVFGPIADADLDAAAVGRGLQRILRVDPLSADAVTAIGIDLEGGIAVFSESVNPTFVVHLTAPAQFQAFIASQQDLSTQSVVTDGVEVFTTRLPQNVRLSWAVADDWLWVHFGLPFAPDDEATWFASSRKAGSPTWSVDWQWAQQTAAAGREPSLLGFVDLRGVAAAISQRVPNAVACADLLSPVGRVAIAIEGNLERAEGKLALDVGASSAAIAKTLLPVPDGWSKSVEKAAIAVQWNADLAVVRGWLDPCLSTMNVALPAVDKYGIRAARAQLTTFDPEDKAGTGAVSLELTHKKFFASLLDEIPLRSVLEKKRTFGPHSGRSLSIPLGPTVDYVLTDSLALAGVGGGMLATMVNTGATTPTNAVLSIDLVPATLSRESWEGLFWLLELRDYKRIAENVMAWRSANVSVTLDGTQLVLSAAGQRR